METYPIISRNPNIYSGKHLSFSLIRRWSNQGMLVFKEYAVFTSCCDTLASCCPSSCWPHAAHLLASPPLSSKGPWDQRPGMVKSTKCMASLWGFQLKKKKWTSHPGNCSGSHSRIPSSKSSDCFFSFFFFKNLPLVLPLPFPWQLQCHIYKRCISAGSDNHWIPTKGGWLLRKTYGPWSKKLMARVVPSIRKGLQDATRAWGALIYSDCTAAGKAPFHLCLCLSAFADAARGRHRDSNSIHLCPWHSAHGLHPNNQTWKGKGFIYI